MKNSIKHTNKILSVLFAFLFISLNIQADDISVSIPSTPFFYIKKALADKQNQLKPLLITQRKSFCNCREATSRSPLRSDRLGGAVRFP